MTTIPQPTDVRAAQFRALQALGSTANPERQGPKEARRAGYRLICWRRLIHSRALAALSQALKQPPERALRPAHGSPGRVDMAVRPLPAARPCVPLSNVTTAIPLDAIPAVTVVPGAGTPASRRRLGPPTRPWSPPTRPRREGHARLDDQALPRLPAGQQGGAGTTGTSLDGQEIVGRRKRLAEAVAADKLGLDDIDAALAELDAALGDVEAAAAEHAARAATDKVAEGRAVLAFADRGDRVAFDRAAPLERVETVALLLVEALLPGTRCCSWPSRRYLVLAEAELGAMDVETVRTQRGGASRRVRERAVGLRVGLPFLASDHLRRRRETRLGRTIGRADCGRPRASSRRRWGCPTAVGRPAVGHLHGGRSSSPIIRAMEQVLTTGPSLPRRDSSAVAAAIDDRDPQAGAP